MARRFWVRVTILLLATTVAYLLFVTFFVSPRAAWFTVASQNGYVLQKVFYEKPQSTIWRWGDAEYSHEFASRVFSDAHIELLLRVPADMKPARGFAASVKSSRLQVRVVASDGRELPCVWMLREDLETTPFWSLRVAWLRLTLWLQGLRNTGNVFPGGPRVAQLHIAVPCGYPSTVRWFEAYLRDPKGRTARYRVYNLPASRHRITPPVKQVTQHRVDGATLSARVIPLPPWSEVGHVADSITYYPYDIGGKMLVVRVDGALPTSQDNEWELDINDIYPEWDSPHTRRFEAIREVVPRLEKPSFSWGYSFWDPYPDVSRYYRVHAELREYAAYQEQVTFTNIPVVSTRGGAVLLASVQKEQKVTTPSGIEVVLPAQNPLRDFWTAYYQDASVIIRIQPGEKDVVLPHSPLYQRVQKPLEIKLQGNDTLCGWSGNRQGGYVLCVSRKHLRGNVIPRLTVTIRQRALLRSIPLDFVVPAERG